MSDKTAKPLSRLAQEVGRFVAAGYSGLCVDTQEVVEAEAEILTLAAAREWTVAVWDFCRGLRFPHGGDFGNPGPGWKPHDVVGETPVDASNPGAGTAGLRVKTQVRGLHQEERLLVILEHYYRFFENPLVVQGLFNTLHRSKAERVTWLIVGPGAMVSALPAELQPLVTGVTHLPPEEPELQALAEDLVDQAAGERVPVGAAKAALGLTRQEAENAFSLGLANEGAIRTELIWEAKANRISSSGFLTFSQGGPGFDSLGGLGGLKSFARRLLRPNNPVPSKGLLLLGPPGTGKSHFAKALGAEVQRPTLCLDIASMYSKFVGDTEQHLKFVTRTADAMGEVVLFVDELDKALAGSESEGDSGVSARVFGSLLTWLSEREARNSRVFFIATCNNPGALTKPSGGALTRAERFDGMFYLGLPNADARNEMWSMYNEMFDLGDKETGENPWLHAEFSDEGWTGAEIRSCCRLAAAMDEPLERAAKRVVPVSRTSGESIRKLREWATGNCLDAETGDVLTAVGAGGGAKAKGAEGKAMKRQIDKPDAERN